jgi:hypothetical protein
LAGLIILIGGIWGGLIPFVGPYFHFTLGPDTTWTWTSARFYLDVLPGIGAVLGGLLLLGAGPWALGRVGALLALASGAWFAVGPNVSLLWHAGGAEGAPHGRSFSRMLEYLTFHTGLGVLIVALAAFALSTAAVVTRRRTVAGTTTATDDGTASSATAPAEPRRRVPA